MGKYTILEIKQNDRRFSLTLMAGVKTPTGDSDRLGENDEHHDDEPAAVQEEANHVDEDEDGHPRL